MQYDRSELIRLLKHGQTDDIENCIKQLEQQNYTSDFPAFMDQMLKEHKVSRKNIALRSGMSQDYTYKLLRGDKRTTERDYILAICIAANMTLAQTQHALSIYGMPILSSRDLRSYIIMMALQDKSNIDVLNDMLDNAGYPLLRTSPDMPKAVISSTQEESIDVDDMDTSSVSTALPAKSKKIHTYEELESWTDAQPNGGNAPFDYNYQGWIRVQDESGQIYQVEAVYQCDYTSFVVFTQEQRKEAERLMQQQAEAEHNFYEEHREILEKTDGQISPFDHPELYEAYLQIESLGAGAETLENYSSLEEAAGSDFFPFMLELEKLTDKKVIEIMNRVDDTRYYSSRIGFTWADDPQVHMEVFNHEQPELREYFQIVLHADGTARYTASHESCYMRLEMPKDLYQVYFGDKPEPEYYIDASENAFSGVQVRTRYIFNSMLVRIYEYIQNTGLAERFHLSEKTVEEERIEFLLETAAGHQMSGRYELGLEALQDLLKFLKEKDPTSDDRLIPYLDTLSRMAITYSYLERNEDSQKTWYQVYQLRPRIREYICQQHDGNSLAATILVDAMVHVMRSLRKSDPDELLPIATEAADLIEHHEASSDEWDIQFEVYGILAFRYETTDLDASIRMYRKVLSIAQVHHLDQLPYCARAVAMQYNNLGWVLWNRLGSEEAVIHYGRSLELLDSYILTKVLPREEVLQLLEHVGKGLDQIYKDTGRNLESERLHKRLQEYNIILN